MRFHPLLISCAVSAFLCATSAQAGVVLGNLGSTGTGSIGSAGYSFNASLDNTIAIPFVTGPAAADLSSVVIGLGNNVPGAATATASLYTDLSGLPGGPLSWSNSQNMSFGQIGTITFADPTPYSLAANTPYWIVVSPGPYDFNWLEALPNVAPTVQNASGWSYPVAGAQCTNDGWTAIGSQNSFSVNAAVVPEPATCIMALAGLACGSYAMFRRRKRA